MEVFCHCIACMAWNLDQPAGHGVFFQHDLCNRGGYAPKTRLKWPFQNPFQKSCFVLCTVFSERDFFCREGNDFVDIKFSV